MNRREFLQSSLTAAVAVGISGIGGCAAGRTATSTSTNSTEASPMDNKELVTYCGLYCGLCDWRTRIPQRAAALRESLRMAENEGPEPFRKVLAELAVPPGNRCCRAGTCDNTGRCGIRKCAVAKGVFACPLCSDFPCKRIATLGRSESTLLHDGQRLKEIGLEAWIAEQEHRRQAGFCYADVRCLPCTIPNE
jgi:hypothetical protein